MIPAYQRFLERFPTPAGYAAAPAAAVIETWGGLGYLRRAFRLQEAAARIAESGWPEPERLEDLPGVGAYTAAALGAFAFGRPVPSVDTNLRRVLSRWFGRDLAGRDLRQAAAASLDESRAGDWNQAMMDLGATLCRPRAPRCDSCPVEDWCRDPSITPAISRQSRFEGSVRQARAAILKTLAAHGEAPVATLPERLDLARATVQAALDALVTEGLVGVSGDMATLR